MTTQPTAGPAVQAAAAQLRDHIVSLDGPQVIAEARCLASSADDLDELGTNPAVSIVFRTLATLASRLDATTDQPVDGAIPAAELCTCHNGAPISTRTLMAALLSAAAVDAQPRSHLN